MSRCLLFTLLLAGATAGASDCLVVAHRGASAYLPEHTLAAYQLAIEQGADYIEPDVVLTADGVPVVRHEIQLDLTTDVAAHPEFAHLRSSRQRYGQKLEGWFVDDFTLAQLKTLRARERWPEIRPGNAEHDGEYPVPTLNEVIALAAHAEREVGLYIEFKDPGYFRDRGQQIVAAAFAYSGDQQIEVIQQHNEAPTIYREYLQAHPEGGLQHLAVWVDDIDAQLAQLGDSYRVRQRYGNDHAYLDSVASPGVMIQLMANNDLIRAGASAGLVNRAAAPGS